MIYQGATLPESELQLELSRQTPSLLTLELHNPFFFPLIPKAVNEINNASI
jgi:hypothetical protein